MIVVRRADKHPKDDRSLLNCALEEYSDYYLGLRDFVEKYGKYIDDLNSLIKLYRKHKNFGFLMSNQEPVFMKAGIVCAYDYDESTFDTNKSNAGNFGGSAAENIYKFEAEYLWDLYDGVVCRFLNNKD